MFSRLKSNGGRVTGVATRASGSEPVGKEAPNVTPATVRTVALLVLLCFFLLRVETPTNVSSGRGE